MIEWIIIGGMAVSMYIILYKYERKMEKMEKLIEENKKKDLYKSRKNQKPS